MRFFGRTDFIAPLAGAAALLALPVYRLRYWLERKGSGNPKLESVPLRPAHDATEMSMNDPQWGKRGGKNDGPPDLDEILRKFKQKLDGIFGQKTGNSGGDGGSTGGPGAPSGAMMGGVFVLGLGLAIAFWLASGFYIVQEGTRGVELRLGKYSQTKQAGLQWRWPYPIETHEIVNVARVEAIEIGHRNNQKTKVPEEALMLTEDQNIVDLQFAVQYTLKSPEEFLFNNKDPAEAVRQVGETAMREIVGKSKMDFVLYEGRGDIAARARVLMQQILDRYQTGILISIVNLQNAQPPEQVQKSFDDVLRANQERERLKNEGQAYANDILPRASGAAARLLEEANGHKQRVIASAQGDASRFIQVLSEYDKAPGVTRERLYLDMMQQVMQSTTKVVVDQKGGNSLLYLPLDKLMQAVQQTPSNAMVESSPPPRATVDSPPIVTEANRLRDSRAR
ncbi:MAG: FtsH protease activity modulator HflK [Burkholderiales bacterium]|nr:FtsH protease activity modulator HflK [Burkholderiales bacterium]